MSLPGIFRRLFDNNGYGPMLRREIVPLDDLDTFRQSFIGAPRWCRSTILPPNHVWADGSLALFADWPEFAQVYQSGGLSGMTLPADATADTIAANPGKWVMNEVGTGLYTPRLGGYFMRNWAPGQADVDVGRAAGTKQKATQISARDIYQAVVGPNEFGGPHILEHEPPYIDYANAPNGFGVDADMSGPATLSYSLVSVRPVNVAQPTCIYMGLPAQTGGDA